MLVILQNKNYLWTIDDKRIHIPDENIVVIRTLLWRPNLEFVFQFIT